MAASPTTLLFLSLLLLSPPSHAFFFFSNYHTLFSLSHSLMTRVATLRAARGDIHGASRARILARNLKRGTGLGFYKFAWNVGWDCMKTMYAWRNTMSFQTLGGVISDLRELSGALYELGRLQSDAERAAWIDRNYKNALRISKSISSRLLTVLRQSGPLKEVVESLQKEITEGGLLMDCLEVGSDDLEALIQIVNSITPHLKGLVQIPKNIALQYWHGSPASDDL